MPARTKGLPAVGTMVNVMAVEAVVVTVTALSVRAPPVAMVMRWGVGRARRALVWRQQR